MMFWSREVKLLPRLRSTTNVVFEPTAETLAEVGEVLIGQLPGDEYPNLKAVGTDLIASGFDYGAEFAFGLDLILDALARQPRA